MITCSRNTKRSPVGSSTETILCSARSCTERKAQVAKISVLDLWKKEPDIMVQETTKPPVTDGLADDLPVSGDPEAFLDENKGFHLVESDLRRLIGISTLRYEANTLTWLSDGLIRNTVETLLSTVFTEEKKEGLRPIYGAVQDIV